MMENLNQPHKIEIKTVIIDSRKLNKSLFGQLGEYYCLDANLEFTGDEILGYVNHNRVKYLLWVKNGLLRKTNLDQYRKILSTSSNTFVENIAWFLRSAKVEYYVCSGNKGMVADSIDDLEDFNEKIDKLSLFLDSIKPDMQLFF